MSHNECEFGSKPLDWKQNMKRFAWCRIAIAVAAMACFAESTMAGTTQRGSGGRPSFDKLLSAFDADKNWELSKSEVPGRVWLRLSAADANADGKVTRQEFVSY